MKITDKHESEFVGFRIEFLLVRLCFFFFQFSLLVDLQQLVPNGFSSSPDESIFDRISLIWNKESNDIHRGTREGGREREENGTCFQTWCLCWIGSREISGTCLSVYHRAFFENWKDKFRDFYLWYGEARLMRITCVCLFERTNLMRSISTLHWPRMLRSIQAGAQRLPIAHINLYTYAIWIIMRLLKQHTHTHALIPDEQMFADWKMYIE